MNNYSGLIFGIIALSVFFGVLLSGIKLCIRDAMRRGKSPTLVSIAVILFFPWGLIAWLLFRPDIIDPQERPVKLSDYRQQ
jgi:hypothetical protein